MKKKNEEITNLQAENKRLRGELARAQRTYNVGTGGSRYNTVFAATYSVKLIIVCRARPAEHQDRSFRGFSDMSANEKRARYTILKGKLS